MIVKTVSYVVTNDDPITDFFVNYCDKEDGWTVQNKNNCAVYLITSILVPEDFMQVNKDEQNK